MQLVDIFCGHRRIQHLYVVVIMSSVVVIMFNVVVIMLTLLQSCLMSLSSCLHFSFCTKPLVARASFGGGGSLVGPLHL